MRNTSKYAESPANIAIHCENQQWRGEEISDDCARAICGQWHAGQASAFYAFASSGHYDRADLLRELSDVFALDSRNRHALELNMLGTYFVNRAQS